TVRGIQTTNVAAHGVSGGFGGITVGALHADTTATGLTVTARVNGGLVQGRDVTVESVSNISAVSEASHTSGGVIAVGSTDATNTIDHSVHTDLVGGTIVASRDAAILATGMETVRSISTTNGSFAGIDDADADATTTVNYDVVVSSNGTIDAN